MGRSRESDGLAVESFGDATVMPITPFRLPRGRPAFRMGVFDDRGRIVRGSLLQRSYGQVGFAAELRPAIHVDRRSVIYAGHLSWHFGHFILESLSRLWLARSQPDLPIVWACPETPVPPRWLGWQRQLLDVLGLSNDVLLITQPTRFGSVRVPEPGYRIKDRFAPQHADFLAAYPARERDRSLRLWLSRESPGSEFGSLHAPRLARELASRGWTVVRPETLPVSEQLELLATAGRVSGEQGSAFHLLALLSDVRGLQVDILCRHPGRPVEEQNQNYQTIAEALGLDQRLHVIPEERVLAEQGGKVRKIATTLVGHLEALGIEDGRGAAVTRPARPMAALVSDVARLTGAATCLEVGPAADAGAPPAVGDAAFVRRDVVRPRFGIDPRQLSLPGLALYEMPAEEFFASCVGPDLTYDLILVDGVGDDAQVPAWVRAAARHAGPATVWLVAGAEPGPLPTAGHRLEVATSEGVVVVLAGERSNLDLTALQGR